MTGRRERRRAVAIAWTALVVAGAVAAGLGYSGMQILGDSTSGRDVAAGRIVRTSTMPHTATGLLAAVTDDGRVTSVVALVVDPSGVGGTIVSLSPSVDATLGGGDPRPIDAVYAMEGPDAFADAVEQVTDLSFDAVEIAAADSLAGTLAPLGDIDVDLPIPLTDSATGTEWSPGPITLTADEAAHLLTAADLAHEDWYADPVRAAVWDGVAAKVGDGVGEVQSVGDPQLWYPTDVGEVVARLFAGPVATWPLSPVVADGSTMADEVAQSLGDAPPSLVRYDRAELAIVFGAIAPARRGTPLDAPDVRVVSLFTDDDAAAVGASNRTALVLPAVEALVDVPVNVVSFADLSATGAAVPDVTRIEVADPATVGTAREMFGALFGPIDVVAAADPIVGVDVEITLGRSSLDQSAPVSAAGPSDVAGSDQ